MRIPTNSVVPLEKLTRYLLIPRPWDDKSQFLAHAGFSLDDPAALEIAIRRMAESFDALEDGVNEYGTFFRIEGKLVGPSGVALSIVSIWLQWKTGRYFSFRDAKDTEIEPCINRPFTNESFWHAILSRTICSVAM